MALRCTASYRSTYGCSNWRATRAVRSEWRSRQGRRRQYCDWENRTRVYRAGEKSDVGPRPFPPRATYGGGYFARRPYGPRQSRRVRLHRKGIVVGYSRYRNLGRVAAQEREHLNFRIEGRKRSKRTGKVGLGIHAR